MNVRATIALAAIGVAMGCRAREDRGTVAAAGALKEDLIASASLEGSVHGTASIVADPAGRLRALVAIEGPPNRSYLVYLVHRDGCDAIRRESPTASWKTLGAMTIEETGKTESRFAFGGVDRAKLEEYAIAIGAKVQRKTKTQPPVAACGALSPAQVTARMVWEHYREIEIWSPSTHVFISSE